MNEELKNVSLNIDLAFENIKPIDYEKTFDQLKADRNELLEALRYFTDRVEKGTIKSKTTYMKFKALISKYDFGSENHSKNSNSI